MYWMLALLTVSLLGVIGAGVYLEFRPLVEPRRVSWLRGTVLGNLVMYFIGLAGVLFFAVGDVSVLQPPRAMNMNNTHGIDLGNEVLNAGMRELHLGPVLAGQ